MVKELKNLAQHVTKEDQLFLEKAWEWIQRVEDQYVPVLSDFLNPHQVSLVKNNVFLLRKEGLRGRKLLQKLNQLIAHMV